MCGFAITREGEVNTLAHRGYTTHEKQVGPYQITFHSLPLSSNNTNIEQPVKVGNYYLVFNGEIFNYKDLHKGNPASDVHYLVWLLKKCKTVEAFYKESIKWDGFWSIALISKDNCYFFTDWLGKKQLYYSSEGIASEIKAILPEKYWLMDYTKKQFATLNTPFDSVCRAIPGQLYEYDFKHQKLANFVARQQYWILEPYNDLYQVIDRSIKQRLENRLDGITMLLSGGLDSNIILHHIKDYEPEILTIENGESHIVEQVMEEYQLNARYISDVYTTSDVKQAMYHYEHPLDYGSFIPNYLLFKEATNSMVLTGDGADELFGGYERAQLEDTFMFDIMELQYYHNIRLDRMSMAWTKEARSPLMSMPLARIARRLGKHLRTNKHILRQLYKDKLPTTVTTQKKKPLRLYNDKEQNIARCKEIFYKVWLQNQES